MSGIIGIAKVTHPIAVIIGSIVFAGLGIFLIAWGAMASPVNIAAVVFGVLFIIAAILFLIDAIGDIKRRQEGGSAEFRVEDPDAPRN